MSGVTDCFSIGSIVACTTCYNQNIEGEVLAFDLQTKILILSKYFDEFSCAGRLGCSKEITLCHYIV